MEEGNNKRHFPMLAVVTIAIAVVTIAIAIALASVNNKPKMRSYTLYDIPT
jgi:hypothetical protein